MSGHAPIPQIQQTTQKTQEWLLDLSSRSPLQNQEQAYSILRAVLHALRDRLTVEEVAHLGAQLPMLLRGAYFEGWRPALAPNDFDTVDEFLQHVRSSLGPGEEISPELRKAVLAAIDVLCERVDDGELRHVTAQLPEALANLFPDRLRA
jgi:uncharacterized protein (DUF2267 family)